MTAFPLAPGPTSAALRTAIGEAASERFQFYDALLLATPRDGDCTAVITEAMAANTELDGVRIVPSFGPDGGVSQAAAALL